MSFVLEWDYVLLWKEIAFLKEYCSVLKPLARGLDILQGEDNCFYGTLLPNLETIIKKIKALIPQLSTATVGLVYTIESSIKHRFAKVFESNNAIIAAITLPKFKLKWVDDQRIKRSIQASINAGNQITC